MGSGSRKCLTIGVIVAAAASTALSTPANAASPPRTEVYDDFSAPGGYGTGNYDAKWTMPYGRLSLDAGATQSFAEGNETVDAAPFTVGADFSVYDHLKYMGVSRRVFAVPVKGSVSFESTITALTPGTQPGRVVSGTYTQSGAPYTASTIEAQQAGVVMNVVDFCTGQLFDWFVTSTTAVPLIERLPSNVTGNTTNPACPGAKPVGPSLMYTQLLREIPIPTGVAQRVGITYERGGTVTYTLNGLKVAKVKKVGVPLDVQGLPFLSGTYPSLGPGEQVDSQISSFSVAHGLFSLIDAFPFQHPDTPSLNVSIPLQQRLFGQGAIGTWDDFTVTTEK
jgi:hypothetical protein